MRLLLKQAGHWSHETIGNQNTEEGTNERATDHLAEHSWRLANRTHHVHHPHYGYDDTEGRHAVTHLGHDMAGYFNFVVMRLDLHVHQAFDLDRIEVAPTIMRR